MKKKYLRYVLIFVILIFAFLIRTNNLDKISGLWYDEMTIYSIASQKTLFLIFQTDGHRFLLFPLYYLIYKFWLTFVGNSDYILRLMSVFFDMLAVISIYFAGLNFAQLINKEEVKEKIGLFAMLLYAINSSFIYYAQEAKFYSLTFFLINVLIIYWCKFLKNTDRKNAIGFLLSNAVLLYTFTSQIVLLIILQITTLTYFLVKRKEALKIYFNQMLGMLIVSLPLILVIFYNHKYFSGNFDAIVFDNSFILLLIQNYFSPILVGIQNNILSYQYIILSNIFNPKLWLYIFMPVVFNISILLKGSKKELFSKLFLSVAFLYVSFHITLTYFTTYNVLVRYVVMVLPFLIIICANGLEILCKKKIGYVFLTLFLIINLLVLMSPIGATKIARPPGYKGLANLLIAAKVDSNSNFILPIRISLLDKYFLIKGQRYSLYSLNTEDCQKTYLTQKEITGIKNNDDLYSSYRRFLSSDKISKKFENYIVQNYINDSKKDLIVIDDHGICMFSGTNIHKILGSGEKIYRGCPIQFLRLSKLENNLIEVLSKHMSLKKTLADNNWTIYVYSKR